ncbi:hypothetical protein D3C85_1449450 [compost metagenome]
MSAREVLGFVLLFIEQFNALKGLINALLTLTQWHISHLKWQAYIIDNRLISLHEKALKNKTNLLRTEFINLLRLEA